MESSGHAPLFRTKFVLNLHKITRKHRALLLFPEAFIMYCTLQVFSIFIAVRFSFSRTPDCNDMNMNTLCVQNKPASDLS